MRSSEKGGKGRGRKKYDKKAGPSTERLEGKREGGGGTERKGSEGPKTGRDGSD